MKRLALIVFLAFIGLEVFSQEQPDYEFSESGEHDKLNFHINALVGVPLRELKEAVNNNFGDLGIGFSAGFTLNPFGKTKPSPIFLGAEFNYMTYGVDKIKETLDNPPLKTTFNYYSLNGLGRMHFTQGTRVAPFVDGLLGMRIFNTRTKIDKNIVDTALNDDQSEVINTTNDTGLNYGLGIGFYTRKSKAADTNHASFSIRLLYTWGPKARYVVRDSIEVDPDGFVTYDTGQTNTDLIQIQFGVMLY